MNKEKILKFKNTRVATIVIVLVVCTVGFVITYAYFSMRYRGNVTVTTNNAAKLNVTTTLTNATAINATRMNLITSEEVFDKSKKVSFSITNENTSNVNAKYIVKLTEMSLTKNLSSIYFKWMLEINPGTDSSRQIVGNFLDENLIAPEGTALKNKVSNLTKILIDEEDALLLNIGSTDELVFSIWLEDSELVDQLYLTNGEFSAKLALEAFPYKG